MMYRSVLNPVETNLLAFALKFDEGLLFFAVSSTLPLLLILFKIRVRKSELCHSF